MGTALFLAGRGQLDSCLPDMAEGSLITLLQALLWPAVYGMVSPVG
jgi:hypothetical protein